MQATCRRLPHVYPENRTLFLTWCLDQAYPPNRLPPPGKSTPGEAFARVDRYMDTTREGPMFLNHPAIAQLVITSLRYHAITLKQYHLYAFVLMGNHVHVLLRPLVPPPKLLQSLKRYTARQANLLLGRTGKRFWQSESYDHWVRDATEFDRIVAYIHNNPVRAGFADTPEQYRWSSAFPRQS